MTDPELEKEINEEAQELLKEMEDFEEAKTPRQEAKRIITSHNFANLSNDEWSDRKRRRNVRTRGGYRHPTDAALAMIDTYYASRDVRAEPETLAVSAIHAAGIMFNGRETQLDLGNQYDISPSSIQKYHRDMYDLLRV